MAYKFDIYHRDKNITFGERFKGEVGKDIFAAKVALGILRPIYSPGEEEIEGRPEFSFDRSIPLDEQKWFDCSTGLGVDLKKAATFDQTLEKALLTFQVNNQFLITCYYFEKLGFRNLLNASVNGDTYYESEIITQIAAALGIFESELRTLGEATLAILHGWQPGTRLEKNFSYTHDERIFGDQDLEVELENGPPLIIKSEHFVDVLPMLLYDSLKDPNYAQNFEQLIASDLAIPESLKTFSELVQAATAENPTAVIRDYLDLVISENRRWAHLIGENSISFEFAIISYRAKLTGNSVLFNATQQVVDYYLENDLFSQTRSPDQLAELARRAAYPDPFARTDPFIIDSDTMGVYLETEYFLRANGPLPPVPNSSLNYQTTIEELEEKALIRSLQSSQKPQIWNFLNIDLLFQSVYFSRTDPEISPDHSGVYPINVTRRMQQDLAEAGTDIDEVFENFSEFKKEFYWVLSTSDVIDNFTY